MILEGRFTTHDRFVSLSIGVDEKRSIEGFGLLVFEAWLV